MIDDDLVASRAPEASPAPHPPGSVAVSASPGAPEPAAPVRSSGHRQRSRTVVLVSRGPASALVERLADVGVVAVVVVEPQVTPDEFLPQVVEVVHDQVADAVVWLLDADATPAHHLARQISALGLPGLPVLAVPSSSVEGDDPQAARRHAAWVERQVVQAIGDADERSARGVRGPIPHDDLLHVLRRETRRSNATGQSAAPFPVVVAVVDISEREQLRRRFGSTGVEAAMSGVTQIVAQRASSRDLVSQDTTGGAMMLLVDRDDGWVQHRLDALCAQIADGDLAIGGEQVVVTPVVGWARAGRSDTADDEVLANARAAARAADTELDLRAHRWRPGLAAPARRWWHVARSVVALLQFAVTVLAGVILPFLVLVLAGPFGPAVASALYAFVVAALAVATASIWAEGFASLRRSPLPPLPAGPPPRASAVVAAYLPNESATIVETVRAILATDYPDLELVLAYNRPRRLPVEDVLAEIAADDPRLRLVPVEGSVSKAQNVNAALAVVTGEFVGIFDADHHPAPNAFSRAWRWIAAGHDVVQGRCIVRNGEQSWISRMVAVEFECIYGVSHPGRSRLHGFAVFGGSNGYWRTAMLRRTRMRSSMLTEDIDASIRVVGGGGRIAHDPDLRSSELAPTRLSTLWWQRLRWSQGWFQVARAHGSDIGNRFSISRRQRLGMAFLLRWREMMPWVSQFAIAVVAYELWRVGGSWSRMPTSLPLTLLLLVSLSTAPAQVLFGWRNATSEMRRHPRWFLGYLVVGSFVYSEWRNVVARVAHVRELFGTRDWIVTPRAVTPVGGSADATASTAATPARTAAEPVELVDAGAGR
ncbi:MAG: glycosyltransferase family 2 protein [Dermatophilaceae bacterium]